jgi:chromosomal replication initiation ATPase DnaA
MKKNLQSMKSPERHLGIENALRIAADHFGVSVADLRSARRTSSVHPARVWAAYLASTTTDASFATIGESLRRDSTVVRMYARACARKATATAEGALLYAALKARRAVL